MTPDFKELVKRLRAQGQKNYGLSADAADALEALAGERDEWEKAARSHMDWRERNRERVNAAESERDRLKAENDLFYAFCNAAWSVGGLDVDWIRLAFINPLRVYKARKALGDVS